VARSAAVTARVATARSGRPSAPRILATAGQTFRKSQSPRQITGMMVSNRAYHRSREPFPADEEEEFHAIRENPVGIGGRQGCRRGPESEEGRRRVRGARNPTGRVVGHDVCARGVVEPVDPAPDRHAVQIVDDPYLKALRIHGDPGRVLEDEEPVEGILTGRGHLPGEVFTPFHQSRHLVPARLLGQRDPQQLAGDVTPALGRIQPVEELDGSVDGDPDHRRERRTLLPARTGS
jgi:hypothetical protein